MCGRTLGRVVFFGLNITDNIKSVGFAFSGDPSVNLRMTDCYLPLFYAVSEFRGGKSDDFFERGRKMRFARIREFFRYFFYA